MRKKHSIKTRVTIWYVSFLVLMVFILMTVLAYSSNRMMQEDIKGDLRSTVEYSLKDVEVLNGELNIDDDLPASKDGISILVYTENNFIVTGSLPDNISGEIPFIDGQVRTIEDSGNRFYVYDRLINYPNYADVWVRGLTSANVADYDPVILFMSRAFFIILPVLILIAAIGGYFITRRAFRPVGQIAETVQSIQAGGDLSKRIYLKSTKKTKDEIHQLASTFDNMLDRLEKSFESEKQFSNDASHELRTPLSVIMAQCEYALKNASTLEEAQMALEVIYGQSRQMSSLIRKLLMMARADRGVLTMRFEDIDVSELTSAIIEEQAAMAQENNISIKCEIEPDITAQVDESMFIRIWDNLISNSIKYGKDGGFILIQLKRENDFMTGSIIDDGIGISQNDLPKIWNRFYQADPSRNDGIGAGLGLAMVKWIISEHGGTIEAKSSLGEGTEIIFRLPLKQNIKED